MNNSPACDYSIIYYSAGSCGINSIMCNGMCSQPLYDCNGENINFNLFLRIYIYIYIYMYIYHTHACL